MTSAAWFDQLAGLPEFRGALRRIEQAAAAQVARGGSLPTPITDRWRQRGAPVRDALWRASCWELAAVESTTPAGRARSLSIAWAIIADARGELVAQGAAA